MRIKSLRVLLYPFDGQQVQRASCRQPKAALWWMQAQAAAEAMRSAMAQVESALEGREAELQHSWQELKAQAAELSGGELSEDGLQAVIQVLAALSCRT